MIPKKSCAKITLCTNNNVGCPFSVGFIVIFPTETSIQMLGAYRKKYPKNLWKKVLK
jgi:hypothetical protein